jgi:hypothetical protein
LSSFPSVVLPIQIVDFPAKLSTTSLYVHVHVLHGEQYSYFFSFSSFVCRWISYVCKPCTINFFAILFYCLIKHFNDAMLTS